MNCKRKWIRAAAILASVIAPLAASAQQIHPSFSGGAEFDTKGSNFYGLGMYVGFPSKSAWSPYLDTYAYLLNFPAGPTRETIKAINPTVGLSYASGNNAVNFGVGYAFVSHDRNAVDFTSINTQRGGESGVTGAFGVHTTGPGPRPYKAEFLSNYNFASHYLWSRVRANMPTGYSTTNPVRIGLEAVGQGGSRRGVSSHAFSFGPTLSMQWTPQFSTGISGGPKFFGNGEGTGAYLNLEFTISP